MSDEPRVEEGAPTAGSGLRTCPACGARIDGQPAQCGFCGATLTASAPSTRPTTARPKLVRQNINAGPPSKTKGFLLIGLIVATVGLSVAIAIVWWRKTHPPKRETLDVGKEGAVAWKMAGDAAHAIEACESKVWERGETLTREDIDEINRQCDLLIKGKERLQELIEIVRAKYGPNETKEEGLMSDQVLKLRLWLADAEDVINGKVNPTDQVGILISMNCLEKKWRTANERLKEIDKQKDDILQKYGPEDRDKFVKQVRMLKMTLTDCYSKFGNLSDYVIGPEVLADEHASVQIYKELEEIRGEQALVGQALQLVKFLIERLQ